MNTNMYGLPEDQVLRTIDELRASGEDMKEVSDGFLVLRIGCGSYNKMAEKGTSFLIPIPDVDDFVLTF